MTFKLRTTSTKFPLNVTEHSVQVEGIACKCGKPLEINEANCKYDYDLCGSTLREEY
jgi:hypothetical protein